MINKIIWIIGIVWIGNIQNGVQAQRRNFIHPGIILKRHIFVLYGIR